MSRSRPKMFRRLAPWLRRRGWAFGVVFAAVVFALLVAGVFGLWGDAVGRDSWLSAASTMLPWTTASNLGRLAVAVACLPWFWHELRRAREGDASVPAAGDGASDDGAEDSAADSDGPSPDGAGERETARGSLRADRRGS